MKLNRCVIGVLSCSLVLGGCTSATMSNQNKPVVKSQAVSPVIEQQEERVLKRTVAIARFTDETKRGNSFLIDQNNNRIGKQASDILASKLTGSGKFIMIEHESFDDFTNASKVSDKADRIGADYLILGSVSEYGRKGESEVGIFSRNKVQVANVTVNIRLVDVKTGQIIYSEEAKGESRTEANRIFGIGKTAGYDSSLDDAALSSAISKLTSDVMENLLDKPWRAYLVSEQDGQFFMTGGKEQGITVGDNFVVKQAGRSVVNPQTGIKVELPGEEIAKVKVVAFVGSGTNELSLVDVTSGKVNSASFQSLIVEEPQS